MYNNSSLFHTPGNDLFGVPSSHTSFYNPSPVKTDVRPINNVMTPEKFRIPGKDFYSMYAPSNYSPSKSNPDRILDKPVSDHQEDRSNLPTSGVSVLLKNVHYPQPNMECDLVPTKDQVGKKGSSKNISTSSDGNISDAVKGFLLSSKPSATTAPLSATDNIQILLNRFRYGKPTHRIQRKNMNKVDPVSVAVRQNHLQKQGSCSDMNEKHSLSDISSCDSADISNLQEKVNSLISEQHCHASMSLLLSEKENLQPILKTPVSTPGYNQSKHSKSSPTDAENVKVRDDVVDKASFYQKNTRFNRPFVQKDNINFNEAGLRVGAERALDNQRQNDILYQWRLRRKLESVHSSVTTDKHSHVYHTRYYSSHVKHNYVKHSEDSDETISNSFSQLPLKRNVKLQAVSERSMKRNFGVNAVPNITSETQTGNSLELESSLESNEKHDKSVNCVSLDYSSPIKDRWKNTKSTEMLTPTLPVKSVHQESSKAGADDAVKNIINNRLFDSQEFNEDQMSQLSLSSTSLNNKADLSVSQKTDSKNPTLPTLNQSSVLMKEVTAEVTTAETSPKLPDPIVKSSADEGDSKSQEDTFSLPSSRSVNVDNEDAPDITVTEELEEKEVDSLETVYQQLHSRMAADDNSYPDDPVLKSLRALRQKLISRLNNLSDD